MVAFRGELVGPLAVREPSPLQRRCQALEGAALTGLLLVERGDPDPQPCDSRPAVPVTRARVTVPSGRGQARSRVAASETSTPSAVGGERPAGDVGDGAPGQVLPARQRAGCVQADARRCLPAGQRPRQLQRPPAELGSRGCFGRQGPGAQHGGAGLQQQLETAVPQVLLRVVQRRDGRVVHLCPRPQLDQDGHGFAHFGGGRGRPRAGHRRADLRQQVADGREAGGGILFHAAKHRGLQRRGHGRELARAGRRGCQVQVLDLLGAGARERIAAGQHVEHQHAQRVDVRALVDGVAADLLGRHGVRRAQPGALGGQTGHGRVGLDQLGDAEVQQTHDRGPRRLAGRMPDRDVAGLQIAVNHARGVSGRQRRADRLQDLHHLDGRQTSSALQQALEGPGRDQLHDDVGSPIGQAARIEDRDDVGVVDQAHHLRLALETDEGHRRGRLLSQQHLDGHMVLGRVRPLGRVDRAPTAAGDARAHPVRANQGPLGQLLSLPLAYRAGSGRVLGGQYLRVVGILVSQWPHSIPAAAEDNRAFVAKRRPSPSGWLWQD